MPAPLPFPLLKVSYVGMCPRHPQRLQEVARDMEAEPPALGHWPRWQARPGTSGLAAGKQSPSSLEHLLYG